jgi:hypothetical protein
VVEVLFWILCRWSEVLEVELAVERSAMKETVFPSLEEALYLHSLLLKEFSGTDGILDKGLLARPSQIFSWHAEIPGG